MVKSGKIALGVAAVGLAAHLYSTTPSGNELQTKSPLASELMESKSSKLADARKIRPIEEGSHLKSRFTFIGESHTEESGAMALAEAKKLIASGTRAFFFEHFFTSINEDLEAFLSGERLIESKSKSNWLYDLLLAFREHNAKNPNDKISAFGIGVGYDYQGRYGDRYFSSSNAHYAREISKFLIANQGVKAAFLCGAAHYGVSGKVGEYTRASTSVVFVFPKSDTLAAKEVLEVANSQLDQFAANTVFGIANHQQAPFIREILFAMQTLDAGTYDVSEKKSKRTMIIGN